MDELGQQKLLVLKAKQINHKAFQKKDLSDYVQEITDKVTKFEDDFGGVEIDKEKNAECLNIAEKKQLGQTRKAYYRVLKQVIEESDVIIEVLDARDPEGCRSEEIEQEALKQNKKVILILNKIDLVPPQNARMWQKYLRREFPCIMFKANTQSQKNLGMGAAIHKHSMMDKPGMIE